MVVFLHNSQDTNYYVLTCYYRDTCHLSWPSNILIGKNISNNYNHYYHYHYLNSIQWCSYFTANPQWWVTKRGPRPLVRKNVNTYFHAQQYKNFRENGKNYKWPFKTKKLSFSTSVEPRNINIHQVTSL